jgi:hypothetical protein
MDASVLKHITAGLSSSIALTFAWSLVPAVLALVAALAMGKDKLEVAHEPDNTSENSKKDASEQPRAKMLPN